MVVRIIRYVSKRRGRKISIKQRLVINVMWLTFIGWLVYSLNMSLSLSQSLAVYLCPSFAFSFSMYICDYASLSLGEEANTKEMNACDEMPSASRHAKKKNENENETKRNDSRIETKRDETKWVTEWTSSASLRFVLEPKSIPHALPYTL